jgi:hypothetical protein
MAALFSRSVSTSFLIARCLIFDFNTGNLENVGRGAQGGFFTNFSLNPLLITDSVQPSSVTASQCSENLRSLAPTGRDSGKQSGKRRRSDVEEELLLDCFPPLWLPPPLLDVLESERWKFGLDLGSCLGLDVAELEFDAGRSLAEPCLLLDRCC